MKEKTTSIEKKDFKFLNLLKNDPDTGGVSILTMDGKPYDGKADFEEKLISKTKDETKNLEIEIEIDNVFKSFDKTGNAKNYDGESDDKALFKQQFYRLVSGWSFAFLVHFNEENEDLKTDSIVHLGAENRPFRMEILENLENSFSEITFQKDKGFENFESLYPADETLENGLIFLSDAYCENTIYNGTSFGKTDLVTFQNIEASLKDPNEGWDSDNPPKTVKRNLIAHGSVLMGENITPPVSNEKTKAFRRIGFNYFKTISKKSR